MTVTVLHGDSREVLKTLATGSVDVCVTDPPYALVSLTKRYGKPGSKPFKGDLYRRAAAGFMGKAWDTGETAFDPAFWAEVYRVLKPGGWVLAFSATRTYHRLACAVEDGGFEIRDEIVQLLASDTHAGAFMDSLDDAQREAFARVVEESAFGGMLAWVYGSGFPKSHDVSKGIDKRAGLTRAVVSEGPTVRRIRPGADQGKDKSWEKLEDRTYTHAVTAPASAASAASAAWQGWGTALKPALEPIVCARKPLEGTVAENVLKHGTGALNIDGCRVGDDGGHIFAGPRDGAGHGSVSAYGDGLNGMKTEAVKGLGRWPANVIHDGSDEVAAGFPETDGGAFPASRGAGGIGNDGHGGQDGLISGRTDAGSASRYFYSAKADADDRMGSTHPTVKPIDVMAWLVRLVTPPGGVVLDPFAGSGSTGLAARREGFDAILIEREAEYVADIHLRLAHVAGQAGHSADLKRRNKPKKALEGGFFADLDLDDEPDA